MAAKPAYIPPAGIKTSLEDFMIYVQKTHSIELESYYDLRAFSINRMNDFWMSFWDFAGIKASQRPTRTVDESLRIDQFPKFFEDAKLNFAENILCGKDDDLAIISMDEKTIDKPERYTWRDMRHMTAKYAAALEAIGIGQGDYMVSTGSNYFFEDTKLNFAENILYGKDDDLAIISIDEKTVDKPERYT
ncbi:putative acetyl-coenzyme A synthetase domain, ANL domain-containing protein [Septoria linicola]|nr:putative acetyl-coenzyme A synthetase domain, ANL domain-containing protein [Septoria linicola]